MRQRATSEKPVFMDEDEQEKLVESFEKENESINRRFRYVATLLFLILSLIYFVLALTEYRGSADFLGVSQEYSESIIYTELFSSISLLIFAINLHSSTAKRRRVCLLIATLLSLTPLIYWILSYPLVHNVLGSMWFLPFIPTLVSVIVSYFFYDMKKTASEIESLRCQMYKLKSA